MIRQLSLLLLCAILYMPLRASEHTTASAAIISQEVTNITGQFTARVRIWANESLTVQQVQAVLPTGWQLATTPPSGNQLAAGDSLDFLLTISYPTANRPFFPRSFKVLCHVQRTTAAQAMQITMAMTSVASVVPAKGRVYFTPYNTVEVWDEGDFMSLRRTWLQPGSIVDSTRIYVAKSSVPVTDILPTDSIAEDWQDDLQLKFVPGLAYAVQMRAVHPDVIAAENTDDAIPFQPVSTNSAVASPMALIRTFRGTISGRLMSEIVNDLGVTVNIPLAGVLIKLKETDLRYNEEFAEATTDANGFFTIQYTKTQSLLEGTVIEPFLKIKSKNRHYDIKVKESAVLGSAFERYVSLGSRGTNINIALGTILLNDEPYRLLHWTVRSWDYFASQGFPLFKDLSIMPYRKGSNFLGDGALGFSLKGIHPTIRIATGRGDFESTIRHEFGHFSMWCLQDRNYILVYEDPSQDGHRWENENTSRIAWSEGWADAIEMILDAVYWEEDREYGRRIMTYEFRNPNSINNGLWSEYYIACAIYDLWDGIGKNVPTTVPGTTAFVGFRDVTAAGVPTGGWSEPDDAELSFYQLARPLQLGSGITNKITHIGEYFSKLIQNVVGTGNCTTVRNIASVFDQNRVVFDINEFNNGNNTGLSSDVLVMDRSVAITGKLGPIVTTYTDTYKLNPHSSTSTIFTYNSSSSTPVALTDQVSFNGTATTVNTLRFNPSGTNNGTFYTCGNIEMNIRFGNVQLGGPSATRLEFRSGSTLRLRQGSTLIVNNNSTLVITCGAQLVFEPGASIQLIGANARLIIDGNLVVMPGATFNVQFTRTTPAISGSPTIPTSGGDYSVNIVGAPSYTWTVPSGWFINNQAVTSLTINGSSGAIVQVRPPASAPCGAPGTITVSVTGCALSMANLSVTVGGNVTGQIQGDTYICPYSNHTYWFQQSGNVPILEYMWYTPWPPYVHYTTQSSITFQTDGWVDLQTIELFVKTACVNGWQGPWYFATQESPQCPSSYSISPNPAVEFIEVAERSLSIDDSSGSTVRSNEADSEKILELMIYDYTQTLVRSLKYESPSTRIPVSDLEPGFYILHVVKQNGIDKNRVIIQP